MKLLEKKVVKRQNAKLIWVIRVNGWTHLTVKWRVQEGEKERGFWGGKTEFLDSLLKAFFCFVNLLTWRRPQSVCQRRRRRMSRILLDLDKFPWKSIFFSIYVNYPEELSSEGGLHLIFLWLVRYFLIFWFFFIFLFYFLIFIFFPFYFTYIFLFYFMLVFHFYFRIFFISFYYFFHSEFITFYH